MSVKKVNGPEYTAKDGVKISGHPAPDVALQGIVGGHATCDWPKRLSTGL